MLSILTKISKNGLSVLSTLIGRVAVFLIIANKLSPDEFGLLSFIYALCSFGGLLIDYGHPISILVDKKYAQKPLKVSPSLLYFKLFSSLVLTLFVLVISYLSNLPLGLVLIVWISILLNSVANLFSAFLKRFEKFGLEGITLITANTFGLAYILIIKNNNLLYYSFTFLVISFFAFIISGFFVYRTLEPVINWSEYSIREFFLEFKGNAYFAFDNILIRGISYLDVLILGYYCSSSSIGIYQASQKILHGILPFAMVFSSVLLPHITKSTLYSSEWWTKSNFCTLISMICGILFGVFIYFFEDSIVNVLFSDSYSGIKEYTTFLASVIILKYFSSGLAISLVASGNQKLRFYVNITSIFIFLFLSILLTKYYGAIGIYYSLVSSSLFTCISYIYLLVHLRRYYEKNKEIIS